VLSDDDILVVGGWAGQPKQNAAVAFSLKDKMRAEEEAANAEEEQQCDYCYTLRTADMEWMKNKYIGEPATRRYGHTATAIGPHLIVFGGWDGSKPLNDVVVLRDRTVGQADGPAPNAGQEPLSPDSGIPDHQQYEEDDFQLETA
jgi:host cell factor